MKNILLTLFIILSISSFSQSVLRVGVDWRSDSISEIPLLMKATTSSCGTPFLSTGYPVWTNYWAGYMLNIINTNACPIVINSFESRFQGTSGYRIYTKVGTFVSFETTAGAWTLVGSLASLTGTSTTAPTAIPISVNVVIPAGATQGFYLTRSDNLIANRHLYNTGAGIAGTTIYSSNADLSITEASYIDPYFAALKVGSRRPSFDVCYTVNCALPIELVSFEGYNYEVYNLITWVTVSESNNDYFKLERSTDGYSWETVSIKDGAGNSNVGILYEYKDYSYIKNSYNYYRLTQVDYNGYSETFNIIVVDNLINSVSKKLVKVTNLMGQEVDPDTNVNCVLLYYYSDGTHQKICKVK